jgi:hypothetical protein
LPVSWKWTSFVIAPKGSFEAPFVFFDCVHSEPISGKSFWSEPITRSELPDKTEVKQVSEGEIETRQVVINEAKAKHVVESKLEATQFGATALIAIIYR